MVRGSRRAYNYLAAPATEAGQRVKLLKDIREKLREYCELCRIYCIDQSTYVSIDYVDESLKLTADVTDSPKVTLGNVYNSRIMLTQSWDMKGEHGLFTGTMSKHLNDANDVVALDKGRGFGSGVILSSMYLRRWFQKVSKIHQSGLGPVSSTKQAIAARQIRARSQSLQYDRYPNDSTEH